MLPALGASLHGGGRRAPQRSSGGRPPPHRLGGVDWEAAEQAMASPRGSGGFLGAQGTQGSLGACPAELSHTPKPGAPLPQC